MASGLKVGEIIDAMHESGEFGDLSREQIFSVIEVLINDYLGVDGRSIRKFDKRAASKVSKTTRVPIKLVVTIVAVFKLRAQGGKGTIKEKVFKAFNKASLKGGTKMGISRR